MFLRKLLSIAALPVAPFYGAFLAYAIYHPPRKKHHRTPETEGLDAEHLRVPLPGSGSLDVWLCRGATDRVVVVGHGIGLSKSASLRHAKFLHAAGYTVCLFDHRNHGSSSRDRAFWKLAHRFTTDVITVVNHVRSLPEYGSARVAVYGFSFSTFPVSYVPTQGGADVDAIICDSGPVLTISPLFRGFVHTGALPIPKALRYGPAGWALGRTFAALGTGMLQSPWPPPVEPYAELPLLFLAGGDDSVVPAAGVSELAGRFPHAELTVLEGTEHLAGLKTHGEKYAAIVLDFLERALGR
ncbi:alpha/beta hydrolase [Actinokineospora inagensis]|uniref:alpha/beta hydrolase n=1 Tax=Actinokineospora inagensis TaxID=103730 RepID=UPI000426064C|nr:alpha/beta fold hydrolase [Actinokineospora inagensis]